MRKEMIRYQEPMREEILRNQEPMTRAKQKLRDYLPMKLMKEYNVHTGIIHHFENI